MIVTPRHSIALPSISGSEVISPGKNLQELVRYRHSFYRMTFNPTNIWKEEESEGLFTPTAIDTLETFQMIPKQYEDEGSLGESMRVGLG